MLQPFSEEASQAYLRRVLSLAEVFPLPVKVSLAWHMTAVLF